MLIDLHGYLLYPFCEIKMMLTCFCSFSWEYKNVEPSSISARARRLSDSLQSPLVGTITLYWALEHGLWHADGYEEWFTCTGMGCRPRTIPRLWVCWWYIVIVSEWIVFLLCIWNGYCHSIVVHKPHVSLEIPPRRWGYTFFTVKTTDVSMPLTVGCSYGKDLIAFAGQIAFITVCAIYLGAFSNIYS